MIKVVAFLAFFLVMEAAIAESKPRQIDFDLWNASVVGDLGGVKKALVQGADVHFSDDAAIRSAAHWGYTEIIGFLLYAGADIEAMGGMPLWMAAAEGHKEAVSLLLDCGAKPDGWNGEPLIWSAFNGHLEIVEILVKAGANIHIREEQVLVYAVVFGKTKVVETLLRLGANVCAINSESAKTTELKQYIVVKQKTAKCKPRKFRPAKAVQKPVL